MTSPHQNDATTQQCSNNNNDTWSIVKASYTTLITPRQQGVQAIVGLDDTNPLSNGVAGNNIRRVHALFLVHGWMGNPQEMNALRASLVQTVMTQGLNDNDDDDDDDNTAVLVHCAAANEGQTQDGIVAGGKRLADEMTQWVQWIQRQLSSSSSSSSSSSPPSSNDEPHVTVSIIGNSLGGLYARHAVGHLPWLQPTNNDASSSNQLANDTTLSSWTATPLVFGTTATPHLGVGQGHTYVPLPRWAERGVALALGTTGADLFRTTTVIDQLTTEAQFIQPLRQFQQRLAYANVHGTDFQVPTATAAFLTPLNAQPTHRVVMTTHSKSITNTNQNSNHMIRLVVETEAQQDEDLKPQSIALPLSTTQLAQTLDALGWTKVFCDVRSTLPTVPLPFAGAAATTDNDNNTQQQVWTPPAHITHLSSAELHRHLATWDRQAWQLPLGHTMMVANAKNDWYANFNAAGRPVMDALAKDIWSTIVQWQQEEEEGGRRTSVN